MPVSPHNGGRQFPTMFHGSAEPIPVGQVVQPGQVVGRQSHSTSSRPFAYATTRRDWATRFAQTGADRTETAPHVYEVEPVGSFEPDPGFPRTKGTGEEHAYRSQQGFRVVREIDPLTVCDGPGTLEESKALILPGNAAMVSLAPCVAAAAGGCSFS